MSAKMFLDTFFVETVDFDKDKNCKDKKFDQVSRIDAKSEVYEIFLTIDINTAVYPMKEGDKFEILISDRLDPAGPAAGSVESGATGYDSSKPMGSRADEYDYIMHGRIFKYTQEKLKSVIYASFGGLLMSLRGESKSLTANTFAVDTAIYVFIKKVQ